MMNNVSRKEFRFLLYNNIVIPYDCLYTGMYMYIYDLRKDYLISIYSFTYFG